MAILDKSRKPYIQDNDEKQFIGIRLPFIKSDGISGWFDSTETTLDAVKQNIKLLLLTEAGERLMQPTIGLNLRSYLFQPIDSTTVNEIQANITSVFQKMLPFVNIVKLDVDVNESNSIGKNAIKIDINFHVNRDPNTLESVVVEI
jgi:phage baseplate assembly protein W